MTDHKNSQDTSGGRFLNVIRSNPDFDIYEKMFLLCFASELNFKGDFMEERYYPISRISKDCSISPRKARMVTLGLDIKGYLVICHKAVDGKTRNYNHYRLTPKIFNSTHAQRAAVSLYGCTPCTRTPAQYAPVPLHSVQPKLLYITPAEITPSVCNIYEPTHTDKKSVCFSLEQKAAELSLTYISNTKVNGDFIFRNTIDKTVAYLCKKHSVELVEEFLSTSFEENGCKQRLYDPDSLCDCVAAYAEIYAQDLLE